MYKKSTSGTRLVQEKTGNRFRGSLLVKIFILLDFKGFFRINRSILQAGLQMPYRVLLRLQPSHKSLRYARDFNDGVMDCIQVQPCIIIIAISKHFSSIFQTSVLHLFNIFYSSFGTSPVPKTNSTNPKQYKKITVLEDKSWEAYLICCFLCHFKHLSAMVSANILS